MRGIGPLVSRLSAHRPAIGRIAFGLVVASMVTSLALAASRDAGEAALGVHETRWSATLVVCPSLGGWTAPACERVTDGVAHASLPACYRALTAESVRAGAREPVRDGWGWRRRWEVVNKVCVATTATTATAAVVP